MHSILTLRKRLLYCLVMSLFAGTAMAGQVTLSGEQIIEYLSGRSIEGNQDGMHWEQSFDASGLTTYVQNRSRPSAGRWKAIDDRYCSQWPPSNRWDCYDFTAEGDELTFIPVSGGQPWLARRLP